MMTPREVTAALIAEGVPAELDGLADPARPVIHGTFRSGRVWVLTDDAGDLPGLDDALPGDRLLLGYYQPDEHGALGEPFASILPGLSAREAVGWISHAWAGQTDQAGEYVHMIGDALICADDCRNEPAGSGFYPCLADGTEVEPTVEGPWEGRLYVCAACGRIIDQYTLAVTGRAETWNMPGADAAGETFAPEATP